MDRSAMQFQMGILFPEYQKRCVTEAQCQAAMAGIFALAG
jgi:hypothetical protein